MLHVTYICYDAYILLVMLLWIKLYLRQPKGLAEILPRIMYVCVSCDIAEVCLET